MTTPSETRRQFRALMAAPKIIAAPGVGDPLTGLLCQTIGIKAVHVSGSVAHRTHGYSDAGILTLTEMVDRIAAMSDTVDLPLIADADTGFGGAVNVVRTVKDYERAGATAIHIEDQDMPKRCGHLDDKRIVSTEDMVRKVRAAVDARTDPDFVIIVRTDALAVSGWDDTMRRCEAYVEAGADVLFVEALRTPEEARRVTKNFDVPLLYNFVESGKSPLIPADELEGLGFKIVIFPGSAFMVVCQAVTELMKELKNSGTTASMMDKMASLNQCFETVGLSHMLAQDARYAELGPAASV